jgi:hypothetical protein
MHRFVLVAVLLSGVPALAGEYSTTLAAAIKERRDACAEQGGRSTAGANFIRRIDLDGDGRDDFILDDGQFRCSKGAPGWCGSGGCSVEVFLAKPDGDAKSILTELGGGYAVTKTARGATLTVRTRGGPVTYRFADGCAIPVKGGGERSC